MQQIGGREERRGQGKGEEANRLREEKRGNSFPVDLTVRWRLFTAFSSIVESMSGMKKGIEAASIHPPSAALINEEGGKRYINEHTELRAFFSYA